MAREIKAIEARLRTVETQIHELEARLRDIGLSLADPELYRDGQRAREIAQSRKDTEERVAWLMKQWEELSDHLSAVSGGE
jgi:chromosome segregation ATPase